MTGHASGDAEFGAVLAAAVDRIVFSVRGLAAADPIVLIDGRSGAGKSSLAAGLLLSWPRSRPAQLVALDSIYPGWGGLERGAEIARERILVPHSKGEIGTWNRWDWTREREAEAHTVDPGQGLIVEGSGVLTRSSARLADLTVWVDGPAATRRRRALRRDGDAFRVHWDMWARQEDRHMRLHAPQILADLVVDVP